MRSLISVSFFGVLTFFACSQEVSNSFGLTNAKPDSTQRIIGFESLIQEGWANLPQVLFWKQIMRLSPDSCLINVAATREILETTSILAWRAQTDQEKEAHRDSLRLAHGLPTDERIFVTTGKSEFYQFNKVKPSIPKGVSSFKNNDVDPWYAQAILLIESPGQLKKSSSGAYGPFQLMPGVARLQGLTVNRYKDERKNFERSAYAASNLIKTVCIPEAIKIAQKYNLKFEETDMWFRMLVLHVYHAGAYNVAAAMDVVNPVEAGRNVITALWHTKAARFGNCSQNYTQLAIASQLILNEILSDGFDVASRNNANPDIKID